VDGKRQDSGLCTSCIWRRLIRSSRGSEFTLCARSEIDPAFPKYPALPVLACRGFEPVDPDGPGSTTRKRA